MVQILLAQRRGEVEAASRQDATCSLVMALIATSLQQIFSVGLLPEGHRDSAQLCCGLEQPWLCVQCPGRNMARHPPF